MSSREILFKNLIKRNLEPVCYSFIKKKITYFLKIITFKSFASVCYNFLKKSESEKNLNTASNEKLLRAASQKNRFFFRGERKYGLKD